MKSSLVFFLGLISLGVLGQSKADSSSLRHALQQFMAAADSGRIAEITQFYDSAFENVRTTDDGEMVKLSRSQILQIFKMHGSRSIPTQSTTVQYLEVLGNTGFVLVTRVKNLGNGWEPLYYSLVWSKSGDQWLLLREFVHQKKLPKSL